MFRTQFKIIHQKNNQKNLSHDKGHTKDSNAERIQMLGLSDKKFKNYYSTAQISNTISGKIKCQVKK